MIKLPIKLDTKRSHRIIQFFMGRSKDWNLEGRDFSVYWSISHMITTAQITRLLALSRGLDPEFMAIAGAIHDIATMETGKGKDHATRAVEFITPLIKEYNAANPNYIISEAETSKLTAIITQHSDKETVTDDLWVETLKDADAIDRYLLGVETKPQEIPRLTKALADAGICGEFNNIG